MHKTISLLVVFFVVGHATAQSRIHRPQHVNLGPTPRHQAFFNGAAAAPAPALAQAPIPTHVPTHHQHPQQARRIPPPAAPLNRNEEDFDYDSKDARYQFSSDIEDHINDLTHQREETREGNAVKGSYSYSDGYYKRTVSYIADENGYRVTGMEAIPLDGPKIDLMGTASVSNLAHGTELRYKVASIPVPGPVGKIVEHH